MKRALIIALCSLTFVVPDAIAQIGQAQHERAGHTAAIPSMESASEAPRAGPHGGSLEQIGDQKIETVVSQSGLQMFVYDRQDRTVSLEKARGAVSVRVEGKAKRYRYDLLPNGKGALTAPVNLSQLAGRQIEMDVHLVGIGASGGNLIRFNGVATVPPSAQQLAAAAIARQKTCPVTSKPLGSMGEPIPVDVNGQKLYVCCAGCVNAVKANPAKYTAGRPQITITSTTRSDASGIARQKVCPVMDEPLGGMGTPIKVMVGNKPIYLCCKGCVKKIQAEPSKYLALVHGIAKKRSVPAGTEQVREGVFKVGIADAPFIAAQKKCPVMDEPLDAMGGPYKVNAAGKAIYICCPGCAKRVIADPQRTLATLKSQGVDAPVIR